MGTGSENREREPLVLQYKTADGRYHFSLSAKKKPVTCGYEDAVKLIGTYPAENRNCRIVRDKIALKAGCGRLPLPPERDAAKIVRLYTKPKYLKSISLSIFSNDEEFLRT